MDRLQDSTARLFRPLVPVLVVIFCEEHLDKFGFDFQRRGRSGGDVA
jgi:hypothetical protein